MCPARVKTSPRTCLQCCSGCGHCVVTPLRTSSLQKKGPQWTCIVRISQDGTRSLMNLMEKRSTILQCKLSDSECSLLQLPAQSVLPGHMGKRNISPDYDPQISPCFFADWPGHISVTQVQRPKVTAETAWWYQMVPAKHAELLSVE